MKIKKSTVILLIILLLYTIVSFYKLGRNKNPQTFVNLKNEEQLTYELPENTIPKEVTLYTGNDVLYLTFFLTNEYQNFDAYDYDCSYESEYVFRWHKYSINDNDNTYKYIMLQSYWDSTTIGELKIYDVDGKEIQLIPMGEREKNLLDEQDTVPTEFSYMNSSYFDEVYFPRTSYEILNNLPIYEYTHPPLGKLIIAIPMTFLGTTPFAYRLMGNIAGILMILVIYAIAKTIFKKEKYGLFAAAIMALDGMHFVQTRIGTVDSSL